MLVVNPLHGRARIEQNFPRKPERSKGHHLIRIPSFNLPGHPKEQPVGKELPQPIPLGLRKTQHPKGANLALRLERRVGLSRGRLPSIPLRLYPRDKH